ncbi:MAG TPA: hypothetical protein VLX09_01720 [Stellaceae bacterium]|nr:hypothetical protein [Stellaceae bacterium]
MRKFILALGMTMLMTGTAVAAEALSDNQMDRVTAGVLPGGIQMMIASMIPNKQIFLVYLPPPRTPFPYGLNVFEWLGLSLPALPGPSTAPSGPPTPG